MAAAKIGPHQLGDGLREGRRWLSQVDGDDRSIVGDVVGGEADDAADGLGMEENERGNDAAPQSRGVVVKDPPEHGEAAVLM
ncbi:hypothetical protein [Streptomyces phaeochromogenes]|uniref:hypothetical protein n=1 Tax=Streptomyces phaeochromogenes TaxID=1923 RepID=UPI002E10DE3C|nr:hypothetical protein OG437_01095 [Streptomyces phaeochromogenes]